MTQASLTPDPLAASITGLILAGGRAQRMGGQDKGLIELAGQPMLAYILEGLQPQVSTILINANRNHNRYAAFGFRVIDDAMGGYCGPLAGIASGMAHAKTKFLLSVPCDSPFLPPDLAARLYHDLHKKDADISVAHDGERLQPVFALLKTALLPSLNAYLQSGERKIDLWYAKHNTAISDFSDSQQTFLNVNTPEQHSELEHTLAAMQ